jgi:hypothetical protein
MRLMLASLIAAVGVAPLALAQTAPSPPPPTASPMAAPATPPPPMAAPAASASTTPPAATPPAATPAPAPEAPPAPPPPPAPPTDPAAISLLSTLDNVCIPALAGGDLSKLAKTGGFHKSGDNYVLRGRGFQFTLLAPGSNPDQCHIDIVHPIDPEAPAKPIVVALHDWAAVERGYSLYRNDKNVTAGQELTTRSWEHDDPGKHEALVITTYRHADGTPMQHSNDTSTVIYSSDKT